MTFRKGKGRATSKYTSVEEVTIKYSVTKAVKCPYNRFICDAAVIVGYFGRLGSGVQNSFISVWE